MAITATQLIEGSSTTDASSYVTAGINPDSDKLYLLVIAHGKTTGATDVPSATGGGLGSSWTLVESNQQGSGNQRLTVLRAMSSSAGSLEAITISFGGVTQGNCLWKVIEFNGVNTSGSDGAGAVVESVEGDDSGSTNTVSLSGVTGGNATFGALVGNSSSVNFTPDTGFTALGTQLNASSPTINLVAVWSVGGTNPISINSDGTPITALIGVEIAPAVTAVNHDLSGIANGTSTVSGSLSVAKPLSGSTAGTASATGTLRYTAGLSGVAAGVSTVDGMLAGQVPLSGVAAGVSEVTGDLTVAAPLDATYLFMPPTAFTGPQISNEPSSRPVGQSMADWLTARRLFRHYGAREVGQSVLKVGGEYITVEYPSQDLIALATEVYLGGHQYVVSGTVAAALIAAGFEMEAIP